MTWKLHRKTSKKGQGLVEFALLIPILALFFRAGVIFYQGYVQENLYGHQATYERSMDGENPSLGQEMMVGLPIP